MKMMCDRVLFGSLRERAAADPGNDGVVGNLEIRESHILPILTFERVTDSFVQEEARDAGKTEPRTQTHIPKDDVRTHALRDLHVGIEVAELVSSTKESENGSHGGSDHVSRNESCILQGIPRSDIPIGRTTTAACHSHECFDAEFLIEMPRREIVGVFLEYLVSRLFQRAHPAFDDGGSGFETFLAVLGLQQNWRQDVEDLLSKSSQPRRPNAYIRMTCATPSSCRAWLEDIEGGERDRVAKLVLSCAAYDIRVFDEGIDEPHLHTL